MHIVCPNCASENKIEYAENILCGECKRTLAGHIYKQFTKPVISATTALVIGALGMYTIDKEFIEAERYPVGFEYELIDSCVRSSENLLRLAFIKKKTKICICAVEETAKEISYAEMKRSEPDFLARFRNEVNSCSLRLLSG